MARKLKNSPLALPAMAGVSSLALPPALLALLLQVLAFLLVFLVSKFVPLRFALIWFALAQGAVAALFARLAGMQRWWLAMQLCFAPALVGASSLHLPAAWYLAGFVLLALVYWSVFRTQVPLFLTSRQAHAALAELLPGKQGFAMADLGSGLGGVLAELSRMRPDGCYTGMETAPLPYAVSKLRLAGASNCAVEWNDFWQRDLGGFDVVYAYLSPVPMLRLWQKLRREMKPGSLFVSNTFAVPGVAPDRAIPLDDLSGSVLYVWRMQGQPA